MPKAAIIYILMEVGIVVLAIVSFLIWDRRYRKNHGTAIPAGFEKTKEVSVDPKSGKTLRIYYNPATGERFYHEENNK